MKFKELKTKSLDELKNLSLSLKEELFNLRVQKNLGGLENTSRIRNAKRDIAKIKTLITQMLSNVER